MGDRFADRPHLEAVAQRSQRRPMAVFPGIPDSDQADPKLHGRDILTRLLAATTGGQTGDGARRVERWERGNRPAHLRNFVIISVFGPQTQSAQGENSGRNFQNRSARALACEPPARTRERSQSDPEKPSNFSVAVKGAFGGVRLCAFYPIASRSSLARLIGSHDLGRVKHGIGGVRNFGTESYQRRFFDGPFFPPNRQSTPNS